MIEAPKRACDTCRFGVRVTPEGSQEAQLQCFYGPPQIVMVPRQRAATAMEQVRGAGAVVLETVPLMTRPPVIPTMWCYQWEPVPPHQDGQDTEPPKKRLIT